MKKIVLVNIPFKDVYTGKLYAAGSKLEMTDERISEVKAVNPDMVSVVGVVKEEPPVGKEPPANDTTAPENTGAKDPKTKKEKTPKNK